MFIIIRQGVLLFEEYNKIAIVSGSRGCRGMPMMFSVWIFVPDFFSLLHVALLDTATSSRLFFSFQKSDVTVYRRVCEFFSLCRACVSPDISLSS